MLPTLKAGDVVLTFNWYYLFLKPKVGDLIVFYHQGKEFIKRIQKCSDRYIFVLGDNQAQSTDSRSFGAIDRSAIIGKVVFYGPEKNSNR